MNFKTLSSSFSACFIHVDHLHKEIQVSVVQAQKHHMVILKCVILSHFLQCSQNFTRTRKPLKKHSHFCFVYGKGIYETKYWDLELYVRKSQLRMTWSHKEKLEGNERNGEGVIWVLQCHFLWERTKDISQLILTCSTKQNDDSSRFVHLKIY